MYEDYYISYILLHIHFPPEESGYKAETKATKVEVVFTTICKNNTHKAGLSLKILNYLSVYHFKMVNKKPVCKKYYLC